MVPRALLGWGCWGRYPELKTEGAEWGEVEEGSEKGNVRSVYLGSVFHIHFGCLGEQTRLCPMEWDRNNYVLDQIVMI